jgi:predicted nuclease of predicted toxin-antitoxin system
VKRLFDENLSPALTQRLADIFPDSRHVHDCSLGASADALVWEYAQSKGFVIVSKDSDFHERSLLQEPPPKVIWIRAGNCSTARIEELIRANSVVIHTFESAASNSTLVLG